jgi:tetratricopeptide (TPR) repeat protein
VADTDVLEAGIAAARAGDRPQAAALLAQAVRANPTSEAGWFWLGVVCEAQDQRAYCLRRALALNPQHAQARQLLESLAPAAPPAPLPLAVSTSPATSRADLRHSPSPSVSISEAASQLASVSSPAAKPVPPPAPEPGSTPAILSQPAAIQAPPAVTPPELHAGSATDKMLLALIGFWLALLLCGGSLAYFVVSHRFDHLMAQIAVAIWSPTPTLPSLTPTPSQTPTVTPTASPVPSDTATRTPTPTRTPTRTPTITPTLNATAQSELAAPLVSQAKAFIKDQKYADAVTVLDKAVAEGPDSAEAYYQRALSYQGLLNNNRFHDEYLDYLRRALDDMDRAIALSPAIGDYYYMRYELYDDLANDQLYRVDFVNLENIATENLQIANELGNSDPWSDIGYPMGLITAGRCEEGMAAITQIIAQRGPNPPPHPGINTTLALGYLCQGRFDKALDQINIALQLSPNYTRLWDKWLILYNMGRLDELLTLLNDHINQYPYY